MCTRVQRKAEKSHAEASVSRVHTSPCAHLVHGGMYRRDTRPQKRLGVEARTFRATRVARQRAAPSEAEGCGQECGWPGRGRGPQQSENEDWRMQTADASPGSSLLCVSLMFKTENVLVSRNCGF